MKIISVGFTGTRKGMAPEQKKELESILLAFTSSGTQVELHHGGCIGADQEAHAIAIRCHATVHIHPGLAPLNQASGGVTFIAKDNLTRNRDIVDTASMLIAAPEGNAERLRSGTWATVRYARKAKKKVIILSRC